MSSPEKKTDVGLAEIIPADNGRQGEKGQTHGKQLRTEARKCLVKGKLSNRRALFARKVGIGQQDNQCRSRTYQNRIDKYTDKCRHTLLHRMLHIRSRVGVRSRTHTCFVGKQTARHAETYRFAHTDTRSTAQNGFGIEGGGKDVVEHRHNMVGKFKQDNDGAQNINNRHKRHDKLGNIGNTVHAANHNHARKDGKHNTDCQRRHIKCNGNGRSDGVCLSRIADKAQRDNQRDGEKARQETRRRPCRFSGSDRA
ncbi:Uncharacterised protein [Neisseria meningitidis]|nr:Uncharacterised protein [Neisseria meningitidis]